MENIETVISEIDPPVTAREKEPRLPRSGASGSSFMALTAAKHPPNKDSANPV